MSSSTDRERKKLNLGLKVINGRTQVVDLDDGKVIANASVSSGEGDDENAVVIKHRGGYTILRLTLAYSHCDLDTAWPGKGAELPKSMK